MTDCQPDASGAGLGCYWPALAEVCSALARSPSGAGAVDEVAVDLLGVPPGNLGVPLGKLGVPLEELGVPLEELVVPLGKLGVPPGELGVPPGELGVGEVARNRGWQATGVGTGTDIGWGSLLVGGTSDTKELISLVKHSIMNCILFT